MSECVVSPTRLALVRPIGNGTLCIFPVRHPSHRSDLVIRDGYDFEADHCFCLHDSFYSFAIEMGESFVPDFDSGRISACYEGSWGLSLYFHVQEIEASSCILASDADLIVAYKVYTVFEECECTTSGCGCSY